MARKGGHRISMIESAKLINLIESEYTSSNMTDDEFAKYASEKTGHSYAETHVNTRRVALGILSNKEAATNRRNVTIDALQDLIATLERRVTKLEFDMVEVQNPRVKRA